MGLKIDSINLWGKNQYQQCNLLEVFDWTVNFSAWVYALPCDDNLAWYYRKSKASPFAY